MKISIDFLENIIEETCFIFYKDVNTIERSMMINQLKSLYKNIEILSFEVLDNDTQRLIFENLFPSYIVLKNNTIKELGNIIF